MSYHSSTDYELQTLLLVFLIASLALAWFIDRGRLAHEITQLQRANAQLGIAHKDKTVRRQNVLRLTASATDENVQALISALTDEDIQIAMEARAGLESMTKIRFRQNLPNAATRSEWFASLRSEQSQWQKWYYEKRDSP